MQQRSSHGFALVEQIAVVLALGTASAVALPRLVELQTQAEGTARRHLAGAASTAMLMNQGACLVTGHRVEEGRCRSVRDCADVGGLLHGGLPEGYGASPQPLARGAEGVCQIVHQASGHADTFTGLGAGD